MKRWQCKAFKFPRYGLVSLWFLQNFIALMVRLTFFFISMFLSERNVILTVQASFLIFSRFVKFTTRFLELQVLRAFFYFDWVFSQYTAPYFHENRPLLSS